MADKFILEGLKDEVPEVEDLSNAERAMLRGLAEPGNPLWKIMRKIVDYREGLTQSLLSVNFGSPDSIEAGRKAQSAALAMFWLEQFLEVALTDVEELEEEKEA